MRYAFYCFFVVKQTPLRSTYVLRRQYTVVSCQINLTFQPRTLRTRGWVSMLTDWLWTYDSDRQLNQAKTQTKNNPFGHPDSEHGGLDLCSMYNVRYTGYIYSVQMEYMFTFAIGSAGRISTVLGIPSYPHPHPLRETNHRWVCVAKLCFCLICIMGWVYTSTYSVHVRSTYLDAYETTWSNPFLVKASPDLSFPPRKPCDCSSTYSRV